MTSPSGPVGQWVSGKRARESASPISVCDLLRLEPTRKRERPGLELDRHALVGPGRSFDPAGQDQVPEWLWNAEKYSVRSSRPSRAKAPR